MAHGRQRVPARVRPSGLLLQRTEARSTAELERPTAVATQRVNCKRISNLLVRQ